jgi:Ca2+-binding RTX toxin-like protein
MSGPRLILVALAATLVVPAGAAQASVTVSLSGSTITAIGTSGRDEVFAGGNLVTDNAGATPGPGCTQYVSPFGGGPDPNTVECAGGTNIVVMVGDGDDAVQIMDSQVAVDGGPGNDFLTGSSKADTINGGDGADKIEARDGNDSLSGGAGDDEVNGGSSSDTLDGGPGRDLLEGDCTGCFGPGNDTIDSRDGEADSVSCWLGADIVTADRLDVIEGDGQCESVDIASGGGNGGGGPELGLAAKARSTISKLLSRAGFGFRISVSEPCDALVRLRVAAGEARRRGLGRGAVTLGSDAATIPEAGAYAATLTVKRKFRAKLRGLAVLRTTLVFGCASTSGVEAVSKKVTFRR